MEKTLQKVVDKKKPKRSSKPCHEDSRSSRKKHSKSKRDSLIVGTKTAEKTSSKTMDTQSKTTIPRKRKYEYKDRGDEKFSRRSSSISKKEPARSRLGSSKEDEERVQKKRCRYEASSSLAEANSNCSRNESKDMIKRNSQVREIKKARQAVATESFSSLFRSTRKSVSDESKQVDLAVYTGTTTSKEPEKTQCPVKEVKKSRQSFTTKSDSSLFKPTFSDIGSNVPKIATLAVHTTPSNSCKAGQSSPTQKKPNSVIIGPHLSFKIQKKHKANIVNVLGKKKYVDATNTSLKPEVKPSDPETVLSHFKQQKTEKQAHSRLEVTNRRSCKVLTLPVKPQATVIEQPAPLYNQVQAVEELYPAPLPHSSALPPTAVNPALGYNQVQVVEELYLARSDKRLEVNVAESYGELTCMEIDSAEEAPANTQSTLSAQQNLIIVLDTNILLSHLDYVKRITARGLGSLGFPVILIPWIVLQELDSLKQGRGLSGSVAHLAIPAISFIYNCIKKKDPHLCGQSMKQASESSYGLKTESNDDRVLQCCLQYQSMYPECVLVLCTNDKNLCCKAILSGVKASTQKDLQAEIMNCRQDIHVQHLTPAVPRPQGSTPVLRHNQDKTPLSVTQADKDTNLLHDEKEERMKFSMNRCAFELEECLRKVLSDVLGVEMEAVYKEIWLEIVFRKPPWTLLDVLYCFKKHWIAVFGHVVSRHLLQTVTNLIDFFKPGKTLDHKSTFRILPEVKEFLSEFLQRSNYVPHAISVIDDIYNQLQPQANVSSIEETSAENIVMNDADHEDKQDLPSQVSHQYVWSTFESIWSSLFNTCMEVFTAVGYDPYTRQSSQPVGSQMARQDALVYLHELSSTASQLLRALSSVLSMAPDMKEIEVLLNIIYSMKHAEENSRVTAKDLLECFSQPDYREKLQRGGQQLMEIQEVLNHCIQVNTFTM
ncbi:transcriptional protein SWT1 [Gouania willdenowi]|uniref:Transcriptional protein SWT1 n=1 Tax=Gouania willdenowi TaxID=441366 RepID=A0A8C5NGJ9_GOUWI|nr:transcriptional protein SWT1 [Gouania willdenowi]XP_028301387.1 transcriptional protein SWT1 [Gouania willdenowi]XP_028301388.1 transcriptional protein SWT1 [Gouania willdenowi]